MNGHFLENVQWNSIPVFMAESSAPTPNIAQHPVQSQWKQFTSKTNRHSSARLHAQRAGSCFPHFQSASVIPNENVPNSSLLENICCENILRNHMAWRFWKSFRRNWAFVFFDENCRWKLVLREISAIGTQSNRESVKSERKKHFNQPIKSSTMTTTTEEKPVVDVIVVLWFVYPTDLVLIFSWADSEKVNDLSEWLMSVLFLGWSGPQAVSKVYSHTMVLLTANQVSGFWLWLSFSSLIFLSLNPRIWPGRHPSSHHSSMVRAHSNLGRKLYFACPTNRSTMKLNLSHFLNFRERMIDSERDNVRQWMCLWHIMEFMKFNVGRGNSPSIRIGISIIYVDDFGSSSRMHERRHVCLAASTLSALDGIHRRRHKNSPMPMPSSNERIFRQ